jgi:hypothetical protein
VDSHFSADCYTEDWRRTEPDLVAYLPMAPAGTDGYNDHFLVDITPGGDLLAIWTQGSHEASRDLRVVYARSEDGGLTWSAPGEIAGCEGVPGLVACFGFPVISASGRIYCFYNKNVGVFDGGSYATCNLRCKYSDDDGRTWLSGEVEIPYRRTRFDHPDPSVPCKCIIWQKPIRDSQNRPIVGISRWSSFQVYPKPVNGFHLDTSAELVRFDNIEDGPDPRDLELTWLPEIEGELRVSCPIEPERDRGYSLCEEPSLALLPDGRIFLVVRTITGRIWYSVSDDDGASWREPSVLRYSDSGREVLHPKSPCPLYSLNDGRFLLLYHNHDGTGYGAQGPWDSNGRRPLFLSAGIFKPNAEQPIWFEEPLQVCDTHGVGVGPDARIWLAMYSSLTEFKGRRILWYPDRKHFLLGRYIRDTDLGGE